MTEKEYQDLMQEVCQGDNSALDFLMKMAIIFRIWDDVWDQDKPIDPNQLDQAFTNLCFGFSQNPFFKRHRDVLEAQIFVAWNAWQAANQWGQDPDKAKRMCAYFIRDYCFEIDHLVAWLVGGKEHAARMNLKIREKSLEQLKSQGFEF